MKLVILHVIIAAICCLAILTAEATPAGVTDVTTNLTLRVTTEDWTSTESTTPGYQKWEHPTPCYGEASEASDLLLQLKTTAQLLNPQDEFLQCHDDKIQVVRINSDAIEMCSEERIAGVQKDLTEVAGELIELTNRLEEPLEEEVLQLDSRKLRLIDDLQAIHVYIGVSPCDKTLNVVYPTRYLIEKLERNFDRKMALFQTPRPTRPPQHQAATPPSTFISKPTFEEVLNPELSLEDLSKLARSNPTALSKALHQIISQRYNERLSTFSAILNFTGSLPSTDNQIHGLSAIYDEMHRYDRNPAAVKLVQLAKSVDRLNASAATTAEVIGTAARAKLDALTGDPDLIPIFVLLNPDTSLEGLVEVAQFNPSAFSVLLPEIISRRYNETPATFETLLSFTKNLASTEHQIRGYSAIHTEIRRHNRNPEALELLKLALEVDRLDASAATNSKTLDEATQSKLAALVNDPELNSVIRTLQLKPEKPFSKLDRLQHLNPETLSKTLPIIIFRIFDGTAAELDEMLTIVEHLPTAENKAVALGALYSEVQRHKTALDIDRAVQLASHVKPIRDPATWTSTPYAHTGALSKFDQLARDLNALIFTGEKASCDIKNVAHQQYLTMGDELFPQSTYIRNEAVLSWYVYPVVRGDKLAFRITSSSDYRLYAADNNTNTHAGNAIYAPLPSERFLLYDYQRRIPYGSEFEWKFETAANDTSQFRILTAKSEDFMFVHKSAPVHKNYESWPRVILGKKNHTHTDYLPNGDLWTLECRPGYYDIYRL